MQSDIKRPPAAPVDNGAGPPDQKTNPSIIAAIPQIQAAANIESPDIDSPKIHKLSFINRLLPDSKLIVGLILIVLLAGIALAILNYQPQPPADKKSLQVAGVNIVNQDEQQASQSLKKLSSAQKINIAINGQTYSYSAPDLGISRDFSSVIDATYSPPQSLMSKLTAPKNARPGLITYIEKKKMVAAIESKLGQYKTTVDASVAISGGNLVVNPGKAGLGLNFDQIADQLIKTDLRDNQTVIVKFTQSNPAILTAAADDAKAQAENLIQPAYGVTDGTTSRFATSAQKAAWLVFAADEANHSIKVSLNTQAAQSTMTKLAQSYSQSVRDAITLTALDGSTSVIDGGQAGVAVDSASINAGITQFAAALASNKPYTLPVAVSVQQPGEKNLGTATGGKFVLVDKALYTAWAIDGTSVDRTMVVSTGRPGLETPSGHFNILSKTKLITMRGCNPLVGCWVVPNVPNAEFFTSNGDALHGTYWHVNWGHQNLSHGCVNLQLADAAWLYDWTVVGTDVVVV